MTTTRLVEVRTRILKENDQVARALRERFREHGVFAISLVSSPGAGKTRLLESLLARLRNSHRVAVVVGDLATDHDAQRLAAIQVPARQITTGTVCHLEASMVERAIEGWSLADLDFLFIENVGNLVCPATYDLGEQFRIVLFSTTEGEDKPQKYPTITHTADAVVLTKVDLADAVGFDRPAFVEGLRQVRGTLPFWEVSAKTGQGLDDLLNALVTRRDTWLCSG